MRKLQSATNTEGGDLSTKTRKWSGQTFMVGDNVFISIDNTYLWVLREFSLLARKSREPRLERGGEEHVRTERFKVVRMLYWGYYGDRVRAPSSAKGHRCRNAVREKEQQVVLFSLFRVFLPSCLFSERRRRWIL